MFVATMRVQVSHKTRITRIEEEKMIGKYQWNKFPLVSEMFGISFFCYEAVVDFILLMVHDSDHLT